MQWITTLLQSFAKPLQWWVVIAVWEQGLRVRFGKRTKHLKPGVHFRVPFLDRVVRLCVRERVVQTSTQTLSTKDRRVVTVGLALRYYIHDAKLMIETVARPEQTLKTLALSCAAEFVSSVPDEGLTPASLSESVNSGLQEACASWGITHIQCSVVTFAHARTIRLLQAHDHDDHSAFDRELDKTPAVNS